MPGESLSFNITADDRASSKFREVGRAALDSSAKMDVAAASLKLWNDTAAKQGKAADTSLKAMQSHAKATALLADAENVLAGKATTTTKLLADQGRKLDDTGKKAETAAAGFTGLAGTGGVAGGGMGALIGAGVALSPVLLTVGAGLGGLGLAALAAGKHSKALAAELAPLKSQFAGFQKELQPTLLTDFAGAARLAGTILRGIEPVAAATGRALGGVFTQLGAEFRSAEWQQFFIFMERTAGPDVALLGQNFVDLTKALPPLVEQLQPVSRDLLLISDATAKLIGHVAAYNQSINQTAQHENVLAQITDGLRKVLFSPGAGLLAALKLLHITGGDAAQSVKAVGDAAGFSQAPVSDLMKTTVTTVTPMDHLGKAAGVASFTVSEYGKNANLTVTPTDRLGRVADVSAASIGHVATAADFANTKIINVRHSVQDLTTALSKGLDPLVNYSSALLTQRADAKNLADALKASGNTIGFQTQKQRDSFSAANTYIKDLENTASTALKSHQGINEQITSLQNSLPALKHAQSHSRLYWQEVRTLISYLDKLRAERNIREAVTVFGTGTWSLSQPGGKLAGPTGTASGWMVSGGTPGKDSVPIMAMPGELVVPTKTVQSGAVDHLRGSIPGFAAGGLVGSYHGNVGGLPPWISHNQAASVRSVTDSIASALARSFARQFSGFGTPGPGGGAPAANAALARRMMPAWSGGAEWAAWNYVAMRESGWSQFARNQSSGAYGIPQALPPSKMGPAANPPQSNPAAQISWMIGYIRGRYGDPIGAAAHERAFNWYDKGGWLPPGLSLAYNGTGRPEMVVPGHGGRLGATVINNVTVQVGHGTHPVQAAQELIRLLNQGAKSGVKLRTSILGPG